MFLLHSQDVGQEMPMEYIPTTNTLQLGEALTVSEGVAGPCGATTAPLYIAAGPSNKERGEVPAIRVNKYQTWATSFSAAATAVKVGNKVTLSKGGMQVTATTTSGVAEIVEIRDNAKDGAVLVRF